MRALFLDSLLAELRKLERVSVIGMDEVRAMLDIEAQKQALGCDDDEGCLAEIAGALGAPADIIGLARLALARDEQQRERAAVCLPEQLALPDCAAGQGPA